MATTASKPTLETLPTEIIQKIWPLSHNRSLNLVSRKLYSSLNNEHVKRTFYRALAMKYLRHLLCDHFPKAGGPTLAGQQRFLNIEGITSNFLQELLERSKITNADLWDVGDGFVWVDSGSVEQPYAWLTVPEGTWVPKRLRCDEIQVGIRKIWRISTTEADFWGEADS